MGAEQGAEERGLIPSSAARAALCNDADELLTRIHRSTPRELGVSDLVLWCQGQATSLAAPGQGGRDVGTPLTTR